MSAVMEAREPSAKYLSALQPPLVQHFELLGTAPGGVAKLRELILTLAIQGKLVAQDPTDAPATELLKDIQAEKDRLIAAKILKRERDEPVLAEDALPFDLPATWSWAALGAVIDIVRGITFPATHKTKEAAPGRIACLRTSNVQQTIEWDDLLFVERSFMGREDQLIQHHDIVMSMANSRELVGKVALIEQIPHPEATFGGFLGVLRPRKIDPRYAMAVLRTPYARAMLIDSSSQTTNIANVSLAKLRPLPFPLPPADEQSRIVTRVEELMRLCDALEAKGKLEAAQHAQLVQTLLGALTASTSPEELADNWQRVASHFDRLLDHPEAIDALEQTIRQLAVRGLLVPQDQKESRGKNGPNGMDIEPIDARELPFEVPPSWRWVRLGSIAELVNGDRGTNYPNKEEYVTTGLPFINTGHIEPDGTLSDATMNFLTRAKFDSLRSGKTRPGDLVYCLRGATLGKTAIVEYPEGAIASSLVIIRPNEVLDRRYAYLYLTSPLGQSLVRRFDNGSAQPNLGAGSVRKYVVPLPALDEQHRIVARVESLRRLCADLRQRLSACQTTQAHLAEALIDEVA